MNATFPLFLIPTKGKSEYLFDKIIKNIISIYEDTGHNKISLNILLWISREQCKKQ